MLAARAAFAAEMILAAAATGALAVCALASHGSAPARVRVIDTRVPLDATPQCNRGAVTIAAIEPACAVDRALYHQRQFADAAAALPASCIGERQLMLELDRAWLTGMDREAPWTDRFDALIRMRELDLVFGGDHAEQIDTATRAVVSRAAVYFIASDDVSGARRAVDAAQLLGVHSQNLDTVAHQLDGRGY